MNQTAAAAIVRACAHASPRRQSGERNARRILASPDAFPADMVVEARVTLGMSGEGV